MLSEQTRRDIANRILECYLHTNQIPLLTETYPDIEIEDSYRIQEYIVEARKAAGRAVKGYKVGLTSKAMQELARTDEPDFSALLDERVWRCLRGLRVNRITRRRSRGSACRR